jgi:Predicted kinase related to galactokinase and mevalonate kinase
VYEAALNNGAFGGRLMGAGGGGFFMFFAPPENHKKIKEALGDAIPTWVPVSFENSGSQIILYEG